MTTRYDLREPQTTAQNPIYPALYPDPSGAVHGYPAFLVTPAPTYTPLPYQHRMAPASHAYHGPAQGYVPAAAPAAYVPPTPAPAPAPGPYVQQNPATYPYSPIPPATYIPSPPTPATGHIPSPPRDAHGNFIGQYSRSPRRGFIPPPPADYHPSPLTPEQRPLPEPVAAAHPSVPGTPNAAFWPPSPPPISTPYAVGGSLPGTPYTAPGTPYAAPGTPYVEAARSRSRSRTLGYPPTPPSSHPAHTPLPPLNVPLAYPAFAGATPALPTPIPLFIPSPFVGTPYLPTAGVGLGGGINGMTAGQILQAEIGYPAPGSAVWASRQGSSWPIPREDIRALKHQGVVQRGEIILAPYLIPNPNDVDRSILEWDLAKEPTMDVRRVTARDTTVRVRGDGGIWECALARGVSVSGEGKVGRVMVQVMSGGNREECIVGELDVGCEEEDREVTIGQLFTELYAWSRSPLNPRDVITMQRDEPTRYDRICAHYHHRIAQERGGSDVDGVRLSGEGLRMCDWLEGRRGWWGAWVGYTGDGRWVLRVGLCDVV